MTTDERREFVEILRSFGVFGSRFNETRYTRRAAKPGNPQPKGSEMTVTELDRKLDELGAKIDGKLAHLSKQRAARAAAPVRFTEEKFGLKGAELFAVREPKVAGAIAEYDSNHHELRRSGLSLRDYVRSAISDTANAPLSSELASALDKLQSKYGAVTDLTQGGALLRV